MAKYNLDKYTTADGLGFPLNFRRGNPNPLDNSSVWKPLRLMLLLILLHMLVRF